MNDAAAQGKLPRGWRWAKLGDVSRTTSGRTPPRGDAESFGGDIPWVKSGELKDAVICSTEETITQAGVIASGAKPYPAGTLLIALYGATVGKLGILGVSAASNQAVCAILPYNEVQRDYLFFYLLSQRPTLLRMSFGGAQPNISQDLIRGLPIPLPPIGEQERIASRLNEEFEVASRARAAAEAQLGAAKELPAAYLRAVFEGEAATLWPKKPLGDAADIGSGVTLGRQVPLTGTRRVPYLRVANVKDGRLDLSDVYTIEATEGEIAKCSLAYGDLLLTEGGDPDKLGRGTFWQGELDECIHQNHIYRVRFDLDRYSPEFISAQIGSSYGKRYFLAHAKQTTGIATINQKVLSGFPLMVPPKAVQDQAAARLRQQLATAERLTRGLLVQIDATNRLTAALLRQAFGGGL